MGESEELDDLHTYGIKLLESIEADWNHLIREKADAEEKNRQLLLDVSGVLRKYAGDGADDKKNG